MMKDDKNKNSVQKRDELIKERARCRTNLQQGGDIEALKKPLKEADKKCKKERKEETIRRRSAIEGILRRWSTTSKRPKHGHCAGSFQTSKLPPRSEITASQL